MDIFTADQAKRNFGALLKAADDGPVTIRKHRRRAYVLMPARLYELYERMRMAREEVRVIDAAESAVANFFADDSEPAAKVLGKTQALLRAIAELRRPG